MASIRRNDTLHRQHKYSKYNCRPAKLDSEGRKLQQRKFRIVKRIFLSSSFDRWRKLRSSLKLTDSSLAWHLMEAHESGDCTACRTTVEEKDENNQELKMLRTSLASCISNFFESEDYINIIGFVCLDFGHGKKLNVKLQKVIKSNAHLKPQKPPETNLCSADTIVEAKACSLVSQPKLSQVAVVSSTPVSTSLPDHLAAASHRAIIERCEVERSAMDILINEQSPIVNRSDCKSFNTSSCSVESGLSVEIDVIGTDSSQEVIPEHHHKGLGEGGSLPSSPQNMRMDEDTAGKYQCGTTKPGTEIRETSNVSATQNYELSQPDGETDQTKVTTSHTEATEPLSFSSLKEDKQMSVPMVETASLKSDEVCVPAFVERSSVVEKADHTDSLVSQPTDHPLDMSMLKSNDDANEVAQRTPCVERKMFSVGEEDGQLYPSHFAKRKAPSEDDDDKSRIVKFCCSPAQKKFHRCFAETADDFTRSGKGNDSYRKEVSIDPDNNNDRNLEQKPFLDMSPSSSLHTYTSIEELNLHGNFSHSVSQDFNVENTRSYQLVEDRYTPEKKRSNIGQSSSPSLLSPGDKGYGQKYPSRETPPCHNGTVSSSGSNYQRYPTVSNSPGSSIPWQRRDMSRKEEYEFLELNPFCDLAEFSARHPHVHQRTYYRWKRRIKEEFMVLEQCPDMTFAQFSGVVLQAKENVFALWKSLIARGKGFFAPSDSSKRLESKLSSVQAVASPQEHHQHHSAESDFLQKNLSASYLDFSQQFPRASINMYNTLKQKSLQEFALFHQNKHMNYKDFSKLVSVSEEVFKEWQTGVQSVSNLHGPSSNLIAHSFQTLQQVVPGKTSDSNGLHRNSFQLNMANALKCQMTNDQSMVPGLSEMSNLSASYLASLQNLMFPWQGYYGLNHPLATQHLLPFMLWPGMPGVMGGLPGAQGTAGSIALLSQLQAASSSSNPPGLLHSPKAAEPKIGSPQTSGSFHNKSAPLKREEGEEHQKSSNSIKLTCPVRTVSSPQSGLQSDREESGDSGTPATLSRSRKQNLQEYIHYLHRPELGFRDLVSLFPSISSRTFYRWRKEINAAVLLLEENPNVEFLHFQAVFPDIPEDIFELWQGRAKRGEAILKPGTTLNGFQESPLQQDFYIDSQFGNYQKHAAETKCLDPDQDITKDEGPARRLLVDRSLFPPNPKSSPVLSSNNLGEELAVQKKCYKEDYLFVQRNPELDFSSFSRQFPNTSVRTFYRWKKELKDAVEFLRCNPRVDYAAYKTMDATVSEEVFNIWKEIVQKNFMFEEDTSLEVASNQAESLTSSTDENYNSALSYLHINPSINYSQFIQLFPRVEEKTFDLWRKETIQLIRYIHDNPNVQFSDLSALLPHVSHSTFLKWKEMPANFNSQHHNNVNKEEKHGMDIETDVESTKSKMTKAFVYLMYNPTISFETCKAKFDFISPSTFNLWLTKIRGVVVDILSHPSMSYKEFNIKDMSPDLFDKLRSLQPQDLALMDERCREAEALCDPAAAHGPSYETNNAQIVQRAFEYLQTNSSISWEDFHVLYPVVPFDVFQTWAASISDQITYLKEKPDVTYHQFTKFFPTTSQEVFDQLQRDNCSPSLQNHAHHFLGKQQSHEEKELHETEKIKMASTRPLNGKLCLKKQLEVESSCSREKGNFLVTESSLSKLAKFAHSSELLSPQYNRENTKPNEPVQAGTVSEHPTDLRQSQEISETEEVSRNSQTYHSSFKSHGSPFMTTTHNPDKMDGGTGEGNSSSSSSLSALECLTSDVTTSQRNQSPRQITQSPLQITGKEYVSPGSSLTSRWQSHPPLIGSEEAAINREDDEAFSSQRQKKMSRAEYMFVKANPEVDSQEFSRIFPGVSARTFYRWKKEIRAQMQQS